MSPTQILQSIVDEAELRGFDPADFRFLTSLNEHQATILVGILKQKVSPNENSAASAPAYPGKRARNKG